MELALFIIVLIFFWPREQPDVTIKSDNGPEVEDIPYDTDEELYELAFGKQDYLYKLPNYPSLEQPQIDGTYRFLSKETKRQHLQSVYWKALRKQRLALAKHKCELCGTKYNLHLHHITYRRLTIELITDVRILCKECHQLQHDHYGYDRVTVYLPLIRR